MQKVFSVSAQQVFLVSIHKDIPEDARPITPIEELELVGKRPIGCLVTLGTDGKLRHSQAPAQAPSCESLCQTIDRSADIARSKVVGDPSRTEEYKVAAAEAQAYQEAGFTGPVPRSVAAWAINGRTAEQAAESILAEAATYTEALHLIRETRLQAKELVRNLMDNGDAVAAEDVAAEAVATIEAAVAGVGNNPASE